MLTEILIGAGLLAAKAIMGDESFKNMGKNVANARSNQCDNIIRNSNDPNLVAKAIAEKQRAEDVLHRLNNNNNN